MQIVHSRAPIESREYSSLRMDPNSFESIKRAVGRQNAKSEKLDALSASLSSSYRYLSADQVAQFVLEFQYDDDKVKAVEVCAPRMYSMTCEQAVSILRVFSRDLSKTKALEVIAGRITDDNWPAFDSVLRSSRDLRIRAREILKNRTRGEPQPGLPPQPGVHPGVGPPAGGFHGMVPQPGGYSAPAPYPGSSPYPGQSFYPEAASYGGMCPPGHSPYAPPGSGATPPQYPSGTAPFPASQPPYVPPGGGPPPQYSSGTAPPPASQSPYTQPGGGPPPQYPSDTAPPPASQPPYTQLRGGPPPQYPSGTAPPPASQPPYAPPGRDSPTSSFEKIKRAVERQNFKSEKLNTLQSSISSSCEYLSADQVAQLVQEFSLDAERLQAVQICATKMYHTTCDQGAGILRVFDFDLTKLKALEAIACLITDNNYVALDSVLEFERGRAREILMNRLHPGMQSGLPPQAGVYPGVGSPAGSFPGMAPQTGRYPAPGPSSYPRQSHYPGSGFYGGLCPPRHAATSGAAPPHESFGTAPLPSGNLHAFDAMEEMIKAHSAMMKGMKDMIKPTLRQDARYPSAPRLKNPKTGFSMLSFDDDC